MAINATALWRVRIGGNDSNGGAFDSSIVGAGTDYSDQDIAQLTLTDLATAGASAAVTSATGGFTAAMIGNAIYIASGTNFTAGTYFIVAVSSTNGATLDRACSTASGSGGTGRIGGAHASITRSSSVGAVAGNTVLIRGQGSNDPVDTDYFYSGAGFTPANGSTYVGYNGRPKIGHPGRMFATSYNLAIKNLSFVQTAGTYTTSGVLSGAGAGGIYAENCVFDQAGFDAIQVNQAVVSRCSFINTGTQVAGTSYAYSNLAVSISAAVLNCHFKDLRGGGIRADPSTTIVGNIVQNCGSHGINYSALALGVNYSSAVGVVGNTVHGNKGHGIVLNNALALCADNLITGHTVPGTNGLFYSADPGQYGRNFARTARNNFYGNAANSNYALSAIDTTIDPQYVNAPTDLTPQNTALRYLSGVGSL